MNGIAICCGQVLLVVANHQIQGKGGEAEPVNMEAGCVGLQYTIQLQLAVLFMVAMALAI
jgi:hypothetical protein